MYYLNYHDICNNAHNKEETQKGKMRQKKRGHAHALILSNYCIFI